MQHIKGHLSVTPAFYASIVCGLPRSLFLSHVRADGCRAYVERESVSFGDPVRVFKHQLAVGTAERAWVKRYNNHTQQEGEAIRHGLTGERMCTGVRNRLHKAGLREG